MEKDNIRHHPSNKQNCPKCMDLWIKQENELAPYNIFVKDWKSTHSISNVPSFTSWKRNYRKK